MWAAYFSIAQDLLNGSTKGHAMSAIGGHFIALGAAKAGRNQVTLMGCYPRDGSDATRPFREAMKHGDDALKQFISQHYRGVGWRTDEALQGMMDSKDFYANEILQVKAPSLFKGRVVMIGDAGYAAGPTGGGTTLALAGAYVLAGEVGKHKGNLSAGLKAYEERMRPLIKDLQTIPAIVPTVMAPQTAWGIWLRNHIFAFVAWTRIVEYVQQFFAGAFASSDKFPLPDYEWAA